MTNLQFQYWNDKGVSPPPLQVGELVLLVDRAQKWKERGAEELKWLQQIWVIIQAPPQRRHYGRYIIREVDTNRRYDIRKRGRAHRGILRRSSYRRDIRREDLLSLRLNPRKWDTQNRSRAQVSAALTALGQEAINKFPEVCNISRSCILLIQVVSMFPHITCKQWR